MVLCLRSIIQLKLLFIDDLQEFFIESSRIPVQQAKLIELMYSQLPIVEDPWKNERDRILSRFRSLNTNKHDATTNNKF